MANFHVQPLWLCLYFPDLPLDQLQTSNDAPLAIAEKQRIAFANKAARAVGIYPDMRLATAHALQPDIRIVERKPDKEAQAVEKLTDWCYQFTPTVMAYKGFSVLLDIGGSLTLFKGLTRLLKQIDQGLHYQGYHHCKGLAHTQEAAWMFSRHRAGQNETYLLLALPNEFRAPDPHHWLPQLQTLPLHYLDVDNKKQQQLFNMGFRNLGDLLALPRNELGKRFGRELLELLTAIVGDKPAVNSDFKPAQTFSTQQDFANGLRKLDELAAPLEQLLSELLRFLNQQQLYTQQLEWRFYYFRQPCDKLIIHTSPANNNLASLLSLSKIKLEHYALKAPLESLALSCETFTQAAASSGELFPELSHPRNQLRDYRQLLDKLVTRLGDQQLKTIALGDEHLPEYQQRVSELTHQGIDDIAFNPETAASNNQRHLPLWLTQKPIPISPPNQTSGPLRLVYGPQRIDSYWWQQRCRRDYFIARHQNGSYCWVFKELNEKRWFLQGFYG
ncbi:MAG: DNA polymerase Y family protein [Cellvibrionaceae bacterium]